MSMVMFPLAAAVVVVDFNRAALTVIVGHRRSYVEEVAFESGLHDNRGSSHLYSSNFRLLLRELDNLLPS
jgi:hypothetical protein